MSISPETSTFAQKNIFTDLSTILKKNVVSIRKHFKRKVSLSKEEPKRILSSAGKHLMYIFTSHYPLQSKLHEIFKTYTKKNKNNINEHETTKSDTKDEDTKDHGIGSHMTEEDMNMNMRKKNINNYVPILLNDSSLDELSTNRNNENKNAKYRINIEDTSLERFEGNIGMKNNSKYVVPKII